MKAKADFRKMLLRSYQESFVAALFCRRNAAMPTGGEFLQQLWLGHQDRFYLWHNRK